METKQNSFFTNALVIIFTLGIGIFIGTKLVQPAQNMGEMPPQLNFANQPANQTANLPTNSPQAISDYNTNNTQNPTAIANPSAMPPMPEMPTLADMNIKELNGEVLDINNNEITLKTFLFTPQDNKDLTERIIKIGENTKIYKNEQKDQKEFMKEIEAFNEENKNLDPMKMHELEINYPQPFTKKEVNLSSIEKGMQIAAKADKNIATEKNINAVEITVFDIPKMPAMPDENMMPSLLNTMPNIDPTHK